MRVDFFLPFMASSAMLGLCCGPALATEVTVVSSRGSVTITQSDHLVNIKASARLTLPAQIKTGADGTLDLKDNDSLVHIGPNSTVALPDSGPSGNLVDRYLQSAGSALYNVKSRHGRPMSVETPYLVSVVKGTVFTVTVEEGASSVTLMEGSLDISAPGVQQHVLLKPNESIRHSSGESSLVVSPGSTPVRLKSSHAEAQTPVTDEVNAAQVALVTRDLSEVGAAVSAQHALSTKSGPPVSATAPAAPGSGSGSGGNPNPPSNGGAPSTSVAGTPSSSSNGPAPSPPASTGTPASSGTSASSGSGSTSNSGSPSTGGTTPGSTGSDQPSAATGASGSNNGSSDPNSGIPVLPLVGCNGKSNGTGLGKCIGHGKGKP